MEFFVTILPFLAIASSLLCWRFVPHRRERLLAYVPILIAVEVAMLMNISFRNDLIDIFVGAVALSLALELVWQLLKIRHVVWRGLVVVSVVATVVWVGFESFTMGIARQDLRWTSIEVARHSGNDGVYVVKQSRVFLPDSIKAIGRPPLPADSLLRSFTLVRNLRYLPLEKSCDRYVCPRGYERSDFSFQWSYGDPDEKRVTRVVGLFVDGYTLWGLKEMLQKVD